MNRIVKSLALALTTAAACAGVTLVGAPAQAAPRPSTAFVHGDVCADIGATVYYVHREQTIDAEAIAHSPFIFREHRCNVAGLRLFKSTANTAAEADFQRHFLATDDPKKPTIYCRTARDHAYFLDLGHYWGLASAPHLDAAERNHYTSWAHAYAQRHGCRLFVPAS